MFGKGIVHRVLEKIGVYEKVEHYGEREDWVEREDDRDFYGMNLRDREREIEHLEYGLPSWARRKKRFDYDDDGDDYENDGGSYDSDGGYDD